METMKNLRYYIEFQLLKFILIIVRNIPYKWALWLGGAITGFFWRIGIRKNIARKNFEIFFGDKYTASERDKILWKSYVNFGKSMTEFALISPFSKCCLKQLVDMDGAQELFDLKEKGQGAILVTGHLGSWELLGASMVAHELPIDFLVGIQSNSKVNEMMNEERRSLGIGIISMGVAARGVMKALRKGHMVAMLSDQDGGRAGIEVEMCGKKVLTPGGPAAFAMKTGVPIITGICIRNDDNYTHRLETSYLKMPELTGNHKKDVELVTQAYTDKIEEYIKKYPTLWFWPHRRFKYSIDY